MGYKSSPMKEKRQSARISAAVAAQVSDGEGWYELPVRDISQGGIFLFTPTMPAEVGDLLTLRLGLPEGEPLVTLEAEIVRSVAAPKEEGEGLLGIGLQFVDLTNDERAKLDELLDRVKLGLLGQKGRAYARVAHRIDVWSAEQKDLQAVLGELSHEGAGLWLDKPLQKGAPVTMEIHRDDGPALKLSGKTTGGRQTSTKQTYHYVQVKFEALSEHAKAELEKYLASLPQI